MRVLCNLRSLRGDRILAQIARAAGVSSADLSKIERGREFPCDHWIAGMESAYGAPVSDWYPVSVLRALQADVLPGQVWADRDPRHAGRTLTVVEVAWVGGRETAVCDAKPSGRRVLVRADRFRPSSRGYRLVNQGEESSTQ